MASLSPIYTKSIASLSYLFFDVLVIILIWIFFLSTATMTVVVVKAETRVGSATARSSYGVDCSFPVHHKNIRCNDDSLGDDRQSFYKRYMDGCRDVHGFMCDAYEESRLFATAVQPQQVTNHSSTGYSFATLPTSIVDNLHQYWKESRRSATERQFSRGSTEFNHWSSSTYHLSLDEDPSLKQQIMEWTRSRLEEWIGIEVTPRPSPAANTNMLSPVSIQLFQRGAVVAPQVVATSAVERNGRPPSEFVPFKCFVALEEERGGSTTTWPLEIYDRDGLAVNITLDPGKGRMLMIESGRVIHGRPFPFEGKSFVTLIIEFEGNSSSIIEVARKRNITAEVCRHAAAQGDVHTITQCMNMPNHKELLSSKDKNGWQAIHEAARSGDQEIVQLLVQHGDVDDINAVTNSGSGFTPLSLVLRRLQRKEVEDGSKSDHDSDPLVQYLLSLGAVSIHPKTAQQQQHPPPPASSPSNNMVHRRRRQQEL